MKQETGASNGIWVWLLILGVFRSEYQGCDFPFLGHLCIEMGALFLSHMPCFGDQAVLQQNGPWCKTPQLWSRATHPILVWKTIIFNFHHKKQELIYMLSSFNIFYHSIFWLFIFNPKKSTKKRPLGAGRGGLAPEPFPPPRRGAEPAARDGRGPRRLGRRPGPGQRAGGRHRQRMDAWHNESLWKKVCRSKGC